MKKNHIKLLLLSISLFTLLGCSRKDETVEVESEINSLDNNIALESSENYDIYEEIDVIDLPDNDSGIKNPQSNFKELFGDNSEDETLPEDYLVIDGEMGLIYRYGDDYELLMEYENASYLTDELYQKMKEKGYGYYDFDNDGLTDEEEIEKYNSNPNKVSTSGDSYSDSYKVKNNLDINKVYEIEWMQVDDNLKVYSESVLGGSFAYPGITYNYLDVENLILFDIGMLFEGDVRVKLNTELDLSNIQVETYNTWNVTHAPIEYEIDNNEICFHIDMGYDKYLIYSKDIDVDSILSKYKRN